MPVRVSGYSLLVSAVVVLASLALTPLATSTHAMAQAGTGPHSSGAAPHYRVIHDFTGPDGARPIGDLISDASGNIYGVASYGGRQSTSGPCSAYVEGCGTVFRLSKAHGEWQTTILHRFTGGRDGSGPYAGLVLDASGNLFGTTAYGGRYQSGVVFELSPQTADGWKYTVIHAFGGMTDGLDSQFKLVLDAAGNLYGTTLHGGNNTCLSGCGVVFELSPNSAGDWNETVLYTFTGGSDGSTPFGGLIVDGLGNLYGTTNQGGNLSCASPFRAGCGVVFELSRTQFGSWNETVLHTFSGPDGSFPEGSLIFDPAGHLYGTSSAGGGLSGCAVSCGVIYELSPSGATWTETVLYKFKPGTGNGGYRGAGPTSGLTLDGAGNLFGTTPHGGRTNVDRGVVFKLSPSSAGWTETVLHAFYGGTDGGGPFSGVILDAAGNLYGTAWLGGNLSDCVTGDGIVGCGVVFEIKK